MTDIDDTGRGIVQVIRGRLATNHRDGVQGEQDAAGEEFVFVGPAWVGQNRVDGSHARNDQCRPVSP